MESHKHNDDLIKRKLDSVSVEPSKLNFTKLEANYQKAKRSSSKKWLLIGFFCILSLGTIFTAYFMLTNNSDSNHTEQLAIHTPNPKPELAETNHSNRSASEQVQPNESRQVESLQSKKEDPSSSASSAETKLETNALPVLRSASTSHEDLKSKSDLTASSRSSNQPTSEEKISSSENANLSPADSKTGANNTSESKKNISSASEKTNAGKESKTKKLLPKNSIPHSNKATTATTQTLAVTEKITSQKNSEAISKVSTSSTNPETASEKSSRENKVVEKNSKVGETKQEEKSSEKELTVIVQKNEADPEKDAKTTEQLSSNSNPADQSNPIPIDSLDKGKDKKSVNDPKTNDLLSPNATVTPAPEKPSDHQFFLSTEVVFSNINYAIKPNSKAESIYNTKSPGFTQRFTDGHTASSYKLFSGCASLSYYYKNYFGVNAGIGFMNVETQVNAKAFATKKTQMVFDHYLYDSSMTIIDTVYIQKTVGDVVVVNGDTVSARDYLNNIRMITIPISFSYKINIGKKFFIEPRAGIQIAKPIKSYQLIAIRTNEFEYKKTKDFMNPSTLFFDLGIRLGYKIGSNAQLYIKQGYFFRNKSIYNVDYALDYSLKSVYTSFGITIRLK